MEAIRQFRAGVDTLAEQLLRQPREQAVTTAIEAVEYAVGVLHQFTSRAGYINAAEAATDVESYGESQQ